VPFARAAHSSRPAAQSIVGPVRNPRRAIAIARTTAARRVVAATTVRRQRWQLYLLNVFVTGFVNLYTRDIEAGLHFYRDLLGFAETFRTPAEGIPEHVELRLNEFMVGLGTVEAAKRVHGVEATPGRPAMVLVLWTDNVDKACADLAAAGVPVLQPPHDTGNSNRNALLRDPDGNLVEIVGKTP